MSPQGDTGENVHVGVSSNTQQLEQALTESASMGQKQRSDLLSDVAKSLLHRYFVTGQTSDLCNAVKKQSEAISVSTNDDTKSNKLSTLASMLREKYIRFQDMEALNQGVEFAQQGLEEAAHDDTRRSNALNSLANILETRYSACGSIDDLNQAINFQREAVSIPTSDLAARADRKSNLATKIRQKALALDCIDILDEAADLLREAIGDMPGDHPRRFILFNALGNVLGDRWDGTQEGHDLDESITAFEKSIELSIMANDIRGNIARINLGTRLGERYQRTGDMSDLLLGIKTLQGAIELTAVDYPDRAGRLVNLGKLFSWRFLQTGAISNLDESIKILRDAEQAPQTDHLSTSRRLNNLGTNLRWRYNRILKEDRDRAKRDLDDAVDALKRSLRITPEDNPEYHIRLHNLALCLGDVYTHKGSVEDLEDAIHHARKAINIIPANAPIRLQYFDTLASLLGDKYAKTSDGSDLSAAIEAASEAAGHIPLDHPERGERQFNLGNLLLTRYFSPGRKGEDSENAIKSLFDAFESPGRRMWTRIRAGQQLLRYYASFSQWRQASDIARRAVSLIPHLAPRSVEHTDKQYALRQAAGLASDAAAAVLNCEGSALDAVALLEIGRGVISGSLRLLRTDVSSLQSAYPELGEEYVRLRSRLDPFDFTKSYYPASGEGDTHSNFRVTQMHEAERDLDRLLQKIRAQEGFESFLLPSSLGDLQSAAKKGPIVMINTSSYRCDALVIQTSRAHIVPLKSLKLEEIRTRAYEGVIDRENVLEWLWDSIAEPVLGSLGFDGTPTDGIWPRVWWIPTGPLSRFPIHASGYHADRHGRTVLDRVVSSYSSSVEALLSSRRHEMTQSAKLNKPVSALLIAMRETPGMSEKLDFATKEIEVVTSICERMQMSSQNHTNKTKRYVLESLTDCDVFHFAGHGTIDEKNPLQSYILLDDWETNPLTVGDVLDIDLRRKMPFLAYLSACRTGQIRNEDFLDEGIHLISAYQLVGFRNVIGTLWKVDDACCWHIAEEFYQSLEDRGMKWMTEEAVSWGLHKAVRMVRDQFLEEMEARNTSKRFSNARANEEFARDPAEDEGQIPLHWVPYVHFGC